MLVVALYIFQPQFATFDAGRCPNARFHLAAIAVPRFKTEVYVLVFHLLQQQRRSLPEIARKLRVPEPALIEVDSFRRGFLREVFEGGHRCVGSIFGSA